MSFGFSVPDIIQGIAKARDIYVAFTDEYDSAPARIKELVDTTKYLHDVLQDCQNLLEQSGDVYPHETTFSRKLDECEAYINRYKTLKEDHLQAVTGQTFPSRLLHTPQRVLQTTQFAFDEQSARDLKDGLQLEIQKLLLYILVVALRRTGPVNGTTTNHQTHPSLSVPSERRPACTIPFARQTFPIQSSEEHANDDSFDVLYTRLLSVRYSYDREMSQAIQQHREANFGNIEEALKSVWNSLCARAGLIRTDGQAYLLPRSRLLEAPSQNYNELVINLTNNSLHSPLNSRAMSDSLLPTSQPEPSPADTFSPTISPMRMPSTSPPQWSISDRSSLRHGVSTAQTTPYTPALHGRQVTSSSINLGDPAIPVCKATIDLPLKVRGMIQIQMRTISLRHWEIKSLENREWIVWAGENIGEILEHYLPPQPFPHTLHGSHEETMHVTFYTRHRLVFKNEDGPQFDQMWDAEYIFSTPDNLMDFQGDIRDKDLLGTFDFDKIISERRPRNLGEATFQDLKIWQDRQLPFHHSISFFASSGTNKPLEFKVLWFQPQYHETASQKMLELYFRRRKESSPNSGRRLSNMLGRRRTLFGRSPPHDNSGNGLGILGYSPPSTGSSVTDFVSACDERGELPEQMKKLEIKFSTAKDLESFLKLYKEAYRSDDSLSLVDISPQIIFNENSFPDIGGSPRLSH